MIDLKLKNGVYQILVDGVRLQDEFQSNGNIDLIEIVKMFGEKSFDEKFLKFLSLFLIDFTVLPSRVELLLVNGSVTDVIGSWGIDELLNQENNQKSVKIIDLDYFLIEYAIWFNHKLNLFDMGEVFLQAYYFSRPELVMDNIFMDKNKSLFDGYDDVFREFKIQLSVSNVKDKWLLGVEQMNILKKLDVSLNKVNIKFLSYFVNAMNGIVGNTYLKTDRHFRKKYGIQSSNSLFDFIESDRAYLKKVDTQQKSLNHILKSNDLKFENDVGKMNKNMIIKQNYNHVLYHFYNGNYNEEEFSQAILLLPKIMTYFQWFANKL